MIGLFACGLALRIREPSVATRSEGAAASGPRAGSGNFRLYIAAMLAQGAAFAVAFAFHQPFALSLGMSEVRAFFIGFALTVLIARVGLGTVPDRFGRKRVAVPRSGSTRWRDRHEPAFRRHARLYGAVLGLGHGFFYPAINALAVERSAESERGKVMTYLNGGFQIGYTIGVVSSAGSRAYRVSADLRAGRVLVSVAAMLLAATPLRRDPA